MQRQLQHQLEHSIHTPEMQGAVEPQRAQSVMALKNNLRERLTKHVVMQQEMLSHLDALVSSEVSKSAPAGLEGRPGAAPDDGGGIGTGVARQKTTEDVAVLERAVAGGPAPGADAAAAPR